jgi:CDP-paratose 2-epimerase
MPYKPLNNDNPTSYLSDVEVGLSSSAKRKRRQPVLVTGGAGFIGINMVKRLLEEGLRVIVLDNLSRAGAETNLSYLREHYDGQVEVVVDDIRNRPVVDELVSRVDMVFHFASQVAVTSSLEQPMEDFKTNCAGTLNLLEAVRRQETPPGFLYTSTNKVYGSLEEIAMAEEPDRYRPAEESAVRGIDETRALNFHTPYGCSKGAAHQYVLDYARTYKIPAVVFRMSCIYGPHQLGTEDQGWVAHFTRQILQNRDITIYGNGKQVRDLLYIDDLVKAMMIVYRNPRSLAGEVFNIGGGPDNAVSVLDVIETVSQFVNATPDVRYGPWRQGDQLYYVSNTARFRRETGWTTRVRWEEGIRRLYDWMTVAAERMPVEANV